MKKEQTSTPKLPNVPPHFECGCTDPGLLRCVHFEGRNVQLIQMILGGELLEMWHICGSEPDDCGGFFDSFGAAVAEFGLAERQLLEGAGE